MPRVEWHIIYLVLRSDHLPTLLDEDAMKDQPMQRHRNKTTKPPGKTFTFVCSAVSHHRLHRYPIIIFIVIPSSSSSLSHHHQSLDRIGCWGTQTDPSPTTILHRALSCVEFRRSSTDSRVQSLMLFSHHHSPSGPVLSWVQEVVNGQPCPVSDVIQPPPFSIGPCPALSPGGRQRTAVSSLWCYSATTILHRALSWVESRRSSTDSRVQSLMLFSHHHSPSGPVLSRVQEVVNGQPCPVSDVIQPPPFSIGPCPELSPGGRQQTAVSSLWCYSATTILHRALSWVESRRSSTDSRVHSLMLFSHHHSPSGPVLSRVQEVVNGQPCPLSHVIRPPPFSIGPCPELSPGGRQQTAVSSLWCYSATTILHRALSWVESRRSSTDSRVHSLMLFSHHHSPSGPVLSRVQEVVNGQPCPLSHVIRPPPFSIGPCPESSPGGRQRTAVSTLWCYSATTILHRALSWVESRRSSTDSRVHSLMLFSHHHSPSGPVLSRVQEVVNRQPCPVSDVIHFALQQLPRDAVSLKTYPYRNSFRVFILYGTACWMPAMPSMVCHK